MAQTVPITSFQPPALCGSVEAIKFWLTLWRGQSLRLVVTATALQSHYGAKGGDEAS